MPPYSNRLLVGVTTLLILGTGLAMGQWHIRSVTHEGNIATDGYDGFPYSFHRAPYDVTTYLSNTITPTDACNNPNSNPNPDSGIASFVSLYGGYTYYTGNFGAPDSTYYDFQNHSVGKVLYDGSSRFHNPRDGNNYPFIMYFGVDSQCTTKNGWGTAYSRDGASYVNGPKTPMILEPHHGSTSADPIWWCGHGWPCDTSMPRYWWSSGEIIAPFIYTDNLAYAPAMVYNTEGGFAGCTYENSLCYAPPGQACWQGSPQNVVPCDPGHAGTATYVLQSTDGYSWSKYHGASGETRFSSYGIETAHPCYQAAWLINIDLAYDPVGNDWYMTRSYASGYNSNCRPEKAPDHIELYKTHDVVGLFYGPWTLLFDGGCANLSFQPDSASILHDGKGNVVFGPGGSLTLLVSSSAGDALVGTACPLSSYPRHRIVVAP